MARPKTRPTGQSVRAFVDAIEDPGRRREARTLLKLMKKVTGARPSMWGPSIVGFGRYHYRYASGREGDWFLTGFSPRKDAWTLYIMPGFSGLQELLRKLGKHRTGKCCLYLRRLADVDLRVLENLVATSVEQLRDGPRS